MVSRSPLTLATFLHTFLPTPTLYYVTNILAIQGPTTFVYRLALLPFTSWMIYRALVSLDFATAIFPADPSKFHYLNQGLALAMFVAFARVLARTFTSQTPQRRPTSPPTTQQLALDAADLTFNLRAIGWNFTATMKVPAPTRPLTPTSAFVAATVKSLSIHILAFDCMHYVCQLIVASGASIYDPTVSNLTARNLHATILTILTGLCIYTAVKIGSDLLTLVGVTVLRQPPSQWPPLFDAPWLATSLTEFWAVRWHQLFRQDFLFCGAIPFGRLFGRPGSVLGAFLVSGALHFVGLWGMGTGWDVRVVYFFLMMGVGVILEGFWRRLTGKRVGGRVGWVWTFGWIVGWGPLFADPFCLSGIMDSVFLPHDLRPSVRLHSIAVTIIQSRFTSS
ncbi:MBOAT-2 domain-containing protein [Favolaschia claudopus]|uniref:MBOAT-2 domain-containing protein n=1 Tax=Favolaschia claudopus TaxID=2862362 RepID=A0AAW0C3B9_9AGAR